MDLIQQNERLLKTWRLICYLCPHACNTRRTCCVRFCWSHAWGKSLGQDWKDQRQESIKMKMPKSLMAESSQTHSNLCLSDPRSPKPRACQHPLKSWVSLSTTQWASVLFLKPVWASFGWGQKPPQGSSGITAEDFRLFLQVADTDERWSLHVEYAIFHDLKKWTERKQETIEKLRRN